MYTSNCCSDYTRVCLGDQTARALVAPERALYNVGMPDTALRVLVVLFAFNEGQKLHMALERFPQQRFYDLMVMDDGSTDASTTELGAQQDIILLRHPARQGIGSAMQTVFKYAISQDYDVVVPMAGNNKDNPLEIPRLIEKLQEGFDFVQGSRYLPGGSYGNMPAYRRVATQWLHPLFFSLLVRHRITDSTNGFRAVRVSLLKALRTQWEQNWLKQYELEPFLFYQAFRRGYTVTEVPVSKIYPPKHLGYTKMKPLIGWWSILKPLILVFFRMRR